MIVLTPGELHICASAILHIHILSVFLSQL